MVGRAAVGKPTGIIDSYYGVPVFINDALCSKTAPKKKLRVRGWHTGQSEQGRRYRKPKPLCYARRVNKKWLKRYGTKKWNDTYMMNLPDGGRGIVMTTEQFNQIRSKLT